MRDACVVGGANFGQCHRPFNDRHNAARPLAPRFSQLGSIYSPPPFFFLFFCVFVCAFFHTEAFQVRHRKREGRPFFDRVRAGAPQQCKRGNFHACVRFAPASPGPHLPCVDSGSTAPHIKLECIKYYYTWLPAN